MAQRSHVDQNADTCSITAVIPKMNLSPTPVSSNDTNVNALQ